MYNRCAVVHYMFDNIHFNTSKLQRIQSSFFLNIYLYFQFNSEVNPVSCFETFVQANLRNKEVSSGVKMRAIWTPGNKKLRAPFFFCFLFLFFFFSARFGFSDIFLHQVLKWANILKGHLDSWSYTVRPLFKTLHNTVKHMNLPTVV